MLPYVFITHCSNSGAQNPELNTATAPCAKSVQYSTKQVKLHKVKIKLIIKVKTPVQ
jgi:hypothetical protein